MLAGEQLPLAGGFGEILGVGRVFGELLAHGVVVGMTVEVRLERVDGFGIAVVAGIGAGEVQHRPAVVRVARQATLVIVGRLVEAAERQHAVAE